MILLNKNLLGAAQDYINRQARNQHPDGSFDNAGRWFPSAREECGCCSNVRSPSRSWPYSLMKHCRSVEHVAILHGVDVSALRKVGRRLAKHGAATDFAAAVAAITEADKRQ